MTVWARLALSQTERDSKDPFLWIHYICFEVSKQTGMAKSPKRGLGCALANPIQFPATIDPGWMLLQSWPSASCPVYVMMAPTVHRTPSHPFPTHHYTVGGHAESCNHRPGLCGAPSAPARRRGGPGKGASRPLGEPCGISLLPECLRHTYFGFETPCAPEIVGTVEIWRADSGDAGGGQTPCHQWRGEGFQDRAGL